MFPLHDDNPTKTFPFLTIAIIFSCVAIFFWQLSLGPYSQHATVSLGMIPAVVFQIKSIPPELVTVPAWATVFTSMFLHGGWMHLISNMLYMWIFSDNIEEAMGRIRFIIFYLLCGIAAAMTQALPDPYSTTPMIGASGAISGILGAYLLLYPHAKVLVAIPFGFIIHTTRISAMWVLGFWFVLQIFNSLISGDQQGGVAWGAHIGGFVAGMALVPFFKKKNIPLFAAASRR